jgi:hypothetical protein
MLVDAKIGIEKTSREVDQPGFLTPAAPATGAHPQGDPSWKGSRRFKPVDDREHCATAFDRTRLDRLNAPVGRTLGNPRLAVDLLHFRLPVAQDFRLGCRGADVLAFVDDQREFTGSV